MKHGTILFVAVCLSLSAAAQAESRTVKMNRVNAAGIGEPIGTITLSDSKDGLVLTPNLSGLPPGEHGIHIHEKPDCSPGEKDGKPTAALGAGGHLDPQSAGKHEGPDGQGHLGDLPALTVGEDGRASKKLTAKRLKLSDVGNRSIIIHEGGDNYSDAPKPLGGGGGRMACGVIPNS